MRRVGGWGGAHAGRTMASRPDGCEVSLHEATTTASSRRDPPFAAPEYLNTLLEDGDQQGLMIAASLHGEGVAGVSRLAEQAELNATTLYQTLSPQGNTELKSLTVLLKAMGMRVAVQPLGAEQSH